MKVRINFCTTGAVLLFLVCFFKSFWFDEAVYQFFRVTMIAGTVVLILAAKRKVIKLNLLEGLWIILLMVPIISNLMTTYGNSSMSAAIAYTLQYACVLMYALLCGRNGANIEAGYKVMTMYLILLVACTIGFYFTPDFYLNKIVPLFSSETTLRRGYMAGNMAGLTSHYSTNGMYMVLAFILAFSNLFNRDTTKWKRYAILMVTFIALFMTGKRAHAFFGVAACIFTLYLYKSDKPRGRILKIALALAVGLALFGILASILPNLQNTITRLFASLEEGNLTTGRTALWSSAIDYFISNPIFGIGFKKYISLIGYDTHNVYLQLICETGIVGFVLYMCPICVTYYISITTLISERKWRLLGLSEAQQRYLLATVCYQTFFIIYCLTGNPLYDLPTLFPYMFSVGITMHYYRRKQSLRRNM